MKRVYHPYWLWEDWKAGMWTPIHGEEKKAMLERAIAFTGNASLYGEWMRKAVVAWPIACEHNLTERSLNRLAWIGHSACCLAIQCPEMVTREAWGHLTDQQRTDADAQALDTLSMWTKMYEAKNRVLDTQMGKTRVSGRHPRRSMPVLGSCWKGSELQADLFGDHA